MSESTAAAAPLAEAPASAPSATDLLVEQWFVETFHNRGLPVHEFNRVRQQADALKERLRAALKE